MVEMRVFAIVQVHTIDVVQTSREMWTCCLRGILLYLTNDSGMFTSSSAICYIALLGGACPIL